MRNELKKKNKTYFTQSRYHNFPALRILAPPWRGEAIIILLLLNNLLNHFFIIKSYYMSTFKNYDVVVASSITELKAAVCVLLKSGWQPFGDIVINHVAAPPTYKPAGTIISFYHQVVVVVQ